jgi:hypothetical protein
MVSSPAEHGITTDNSGKPLLLQDSRLATNTFGLDGLYYYSAPKPKYLFFVRFVRVGASSTTSVSNLVPSVAQDMTSGQDMAHNLGFIVKTVDQPKVSLETETVNQYNKKRIIQKRVEYQPINIKFHDTVDNRVYQMFQSYFKHYYGDPNSRNTLDWSQDQISGQFKSNGTGWGFIASNMVGSLADYFNTLEVYQVFASYYNRYDLINPKITVFDPDEHDFAGTSTHEISMTIAYEGINYVANSTSTLQNSNLVATMGLDKSDFYEPEAAYPVAAMFGQDGFIDDSSGLLRNQGFAGNFASNVLTNVFQSFDGGNKLNIGGVLKGSFNQSANTFLNQNSVVGRIGSGVSYNVTNAGLINQTPLSSLIPSLRGLNLFG